ncbi:hypothetical protein EDB83DRAFT_2316959 [Lactarius deliciosus]|nr:hypothetical protein EDB83DRAFT_2316959 [Lactarius deliciosus]
MRAAADTKNKTSEGTDKKFEDAIIELSAYGQKYHKKQRDLAQIAETMRSAKEKDRSSSNILNRLFKQRSKEKSQPEPVEAPTKVVQFLLSGSLPDKDPEVVKRVAEVLCRKSNMEEVLWNFNRLKNKQRITLKQNPHFYRGLPSFGSAYSDFFSTDPIYEFWDTSNEIRVLTDERSRVFLETDKRNRAFGNFWMPDKAIIFKDVGGKLEGEGIVAKDIQGTPNLWRREEPTPRVTGPTICPAIPGDLPPEEWKQLHTHQHQGHVSAVSRRLGNPYILRASIVLTRAQVLSPPGSPTIPTPGSQARSFSTTQTGSSGASSGAITPAQLTAPRIPEPSHRPLSAASFEIARSTNSPVSQTPQTVTPPPSAPPSTLSRPQKSSVAEPPLPKKPQNPPPPQASLLPSVVPLKPEPPPQETTPITATTLIFSRTLTAGGVSPSPPSLSLVPSTDNLAPSLGLHNGGTQVGNRTSILASVTVTIQAQASSPLARQQQAESAAVPVKDPATQGKKKNWFQKHVWDYRHMSAFIKYWKNGSTILLTGSLRMWRMAQNLLPHFALCHTSPASPASQRISVIMFGDNDDLSLRICLMLDGRMVMYLMHTGYRRTLTKVLVDLEL